MLRGPAPVLEPTPLEPAPLEPTPLGPAALEPAPLEPDVLGPAPPLEPRFALLFIKSNEKMIESSLTEFNSNPGMFVLLRNSSL